MTDQPQEQPVVVAVAPVAEDSGTSLDEATVAQAVADNGTQVRESLVAMQTELAGTASTGVPAVDAALARLGELDPDDLSGSAQILDDVLRQLETVMGEAPQE